ncbi:MAG: hypothetical protein QOG54_1994 [Actinomycetota bacterium]|jgi:hypothetical protein|nr:hypothetical protein [Actinomycetota bacterium]
MNLRKWAFYLLIAFCVVFVIQQPEEAAKLVKATGENAGEWFSAASDAFTKFVRSLV